MTGGEPIPRIHHLAALHDRVLQGSLPPVSAIMPNRKHGETLSPRALPFGFAKGFHREPKQALPDSAGNRGLGLVPGRPGTSGAFAGQTM